MELIIITLLIVGATLWVIYRRSTSSGSKPYNQSERDRLFLETIRRETLDKQKSIPDSNPAKTPVPPSAPVIPPVKMTPPPTQTVPEAPAAPAPVPKTEQTEPVKTEAPAVSAYRKGSIGATVEEITKKADSSGVTVEISADESVMNLTDRELISLASLMLKRAVTACEKGETKNMEFSARKTVSDVVLSCKYPDIKNDAIIQSRAMLKFSAEKIKGVFVSSDNGVISSEQAIIPFSSIKY